MLSWPKVDPTHRAFLHLQEHWQTCACRKCLEFSRWFAPEHPAETDDELPRFQRRAPPSPNRRRSLSRYQAWDETLAPQQSLEGPWALVSHKGNRVHVHSHPRPERTARNRAM